MSDGRFVIATNEQIEEAYERTARQFGLLSPNERIVIRPKRQAIVWVSRPTTEGEE